MPSKSVLGREALRRTLAKLSPALRTELQDSLNKSGDDIIARQKQLVPVREGTLRDSIRKESFSKGGIGVIIKSGGPTTTKPVRQGQSATYDYAMGVELGTQDMLAEPFFYPGYRQKKSAAKRRASRAVKKAVDKATK